LKNDAGRPAFSVRVRGQGFSSLKNPRVIWMGLADAKNAHLASETDRGPLGENWIELRIVLPTHLTLEG